MAQAQQMRRLNMASAQSLRASGWCAISPMAPQAFWTNSCVPEKSPRSIDPQALAIVELRRKLILSARIASYMGVSRATVSRVLRRAGLSRLSDLRQNEPVQRYERECSGELLRIDIKKLGRFNKVGHRITGDRTQRARNIG
nr:hypothetical protein [Xylophilus sp. Leaf220]